MSAAGLTPASPSVVSSAWISVCLTRNAANASKQWQRLCASWSFWQNMIPSNMDPLFKMCYGSGQQHGSSLFKMCYGSGDLINFDPIHGMPHYRVSFDILWPFSSEPTHNLCSQNGCNKATRTKCWNLLLYATHFLHRFAQYWRIYFTRLTFTF